MYRLEKLMIDIEEMQDQLMIVHEEFGGDFLHPKVIRASQRLDRLIIKYMKLRNLHVNAYDKYKVDSNKTKNNFISLSLGG